MRIINILLTTFFLFLPAFSYAEGTCTDSLLKKPPFNNKGLIVTQNPDLYISKASQRITKNNKLSFNQPVDILEQSKAQNRYLIRFEDKKSKDKSCLWISFKNIVQSNRSKPLYLEQLKEKEAYDQYWKTRYGSRLLAKVMTKTAELKEHGKSTFKGVSLLDAPEGNEIGNVGFFTVLFVFKKTTLNNKNYYLVSGSTIYSGEGENEYFSWVSEDDVSPWPTRISLYYGEDDRIVHIWHTLDDLENHNKKRVGPIASEPENIKDLTPSKRVTAKFPVLLKKGIQIDKDHEAYEILYYGKVSLANKLTTSTSACKQGDSECLTGQQILLELDKIRIIGDNAKNADIVFLIDATKSMDKYFSIVKKAIISISQRVAVHHGRVRIGIATYGDYLSKSNPTKDNLQFKKVSSLSFLDANKGEILLKKINKISLFSNDAIHDKTEAPYAAIIKSTESFEWADASGNRLLIWIADHGNHDGTKGLDKLGSTDIYNEKQVSDSLSNKKISLVAIHVSGDAKSAQQRTVLADRFIKQATKIINLNQLPSFGPYSTSKKQDDLTSTQRNIEEVLGYILDFSEDLPKYLYCKTHNCKSTSSYIAQESHPVAIFRNEFLMKMGISKNDLDKYKDLTQVITEGFVSHQKATNDLEFWVALDPRTFHKILGTTVDLCFGLRDTSVGRAIDAMILDLTRAYGGDPYDPDNETISTYLERILSIPKESFDTLLDITRSDIEKKVLASPKFVKELRDRVCISAKLLGMVRDGEKIDPKYLSYNGKKRRVIIQKGKKAQAFKWTWATPKGIALRYIPVSFLP